MYTKQETLEGEEGESRSSGNGHFPKLMIDTRPQTPVAQKIPSRANIKNLHIRVSYSNYKKIGAPGWLLS